MRRARIKAEGEGFYHVVSRIGGRRFLLDDKEKGILLGFIRAAATFSGVEVYTYALMDNHFHLLIRVPKPEEVDDGELKRRIRALYGASRSSRVFEQWAKWESSGQGSRVAEAKERFRSRMYDLSQFCKTFKEAFTQDYNRRHDNTGTIWEGRFKSILLEGSYRALMTVGGYIHLNPVRAEMVKNPEDAENTGYGAACRGDAASRKGLTSLLSRVSDGGETSWNRVQEACWHALDGELAGDDVDEASRHSERGNDGDGETLEGGGEEIPSMRDLLRSKQIGFLHGGALGESGFLQGVAALLPPRTRRRTPGILDQCPGLGLTSVLGVREAS